MPAARKALENIKAGDFGIGVMTTALDKIFTDKTQQANA